MTITTFLDRLLWLDGAPLVVDPYRRELFTRFFDQLEPGTTRPQYNLGLFGRGKKNAKTLDAMLAALWAVMSDSPQGSQVYVLANDADQAGDDLDLLKKLITANPALSDFLITRRDAVERRDGGGFIQVLPAQDVAGAHGKTYRLAVFDEIHAYKSWDLFEALAFDPTRPDSQQWITSYATLYHRPGVPLFDMYNLGKGGTDPRMLFSWYAGDFTTDPAFAESTPEVRANPSMSSWANPDYLDQQRGRLPSHKFRRLHLNLPGQPEGAAYQPEPVMGAVVRGVGDRPPEPGRVYQAFVDMSGGSSDDAVLAIAHLEAGVAVVDRVLDQGCLPPFDPRRAIARFVPVLKRYGVSSVTGDKYAGETFLFDFRGHGIAYNVSKKDKTELYEDLEPTLNGNRTALLDLPKLESQLLALAWRGGRIDHPSGEHDDYANAVAGVVGKVLERKRRSGLTWGRDAKPTPLAPSTTVRRLATGTRVLITNPSPAEEASIVGHRPRY